MLKRKRRGARKIGHVQNTAQNVIMKVIYTCARTRKDRYLNVYLQLYRQTFGRELK